MQVDVVTTTDALDALRGAWDALWRRAPAATPFQSPAWILPWWRHLGAGKPHLLVLRRGAALAGLAPLFVHERRDDGRASGSRCLAFMGTGITDYLDVLLYPDIAEAGVALLLDRLASNVGEWSEVRLADVPAGSPLLTLRNQSKGALHVRRCSVCPVVPLALTIEEQLARLSQGRRRKLRVARRRLEALGCVRIERATAETVDESVDALFTLHTARWRERGLPGMLAEPAVRAFHREAAPALLEQGVLRLHVLRLDERPIAALYGLARGDRWYSYLDGFDPRYEELSPGTVLVSHAVEEAIAEGCTAFDFLRGGERYKYSWGAADECTFEICIGGEARD